ncbi:AMP-binding protein [Chloroflexota bacterium]
MSDIRTCGALLTERAKANPDDTFYVIDGVSFTYHEVDERSNKIAHSLNGLGISKGDRVCVLLRSSIDHICAWFGTVKIGAIFVPINLQLQEDQMAHIINNCETQFLMVEADLLSQVEAMKAKIPGIRTVIVCGENVPASIPKWEIVPFEQLYHGSSDPVDSEVTNADLACLLYTSGTTGPPKGVMLSHEYYIAGGELLVDLMSETKNDVFYATLPLYHVMGQIHGVATALQVGGKAVLVDRFSVTRFWEDVGKYGITCICITGTQCNYLYQQPPKAGDAENSLRVVMAFPMPGHIVGDFEKRFGLRMRSIYGLTEALLPISSRYDQSYKVGSLGWATDYEVRVADDTDNELPANEVGNILVRPIATSRRVFDGYYKMPEATVEMLKHCWFHTGDVGYKDEDGLIWFASRKKDVVRFRGENVSAGQVENIINANSKVAECAVIGVPSDVGEEDIKVLVRLKGKQILKPEELLAFCEEKMTWFMIPRYVEFVQDLPKTSTDKVEKFKLKDNWKNSNTWDREAASYKLKR